MSRTCLILVIIFASLYAVAFLLFLTGTYGWFGSPKGPLAGVFLIPLGLPWNLLLDSLPPGIRPFAAAAAPGINLFLLWSLCRWWSTR